MTAEQFVHSLQELQIGVVAVNIKEKKIFFFYIALTLNLQVSE
jgi:hypothetical protein